MMPKSVAQRRVLITGASGFIGTHVIERLKVDAAMTLTNIDIAAPHLGSHKRLWKQTNVMDEQSLHETIVNFEPTDVIHMASRTDTNGRTLSDYNVNIAGTRNVLRELRRYPGTRFILVSSQFVVGPGRTAERDDDYRPHTLYGKSKALAEDAARSGDFGGCWTIVRPTNIWGPWHPRYPAECWRVIRRRLYLHPGRQPVIRSYGYVRNVAEQIASILALPEPAVHGRTLYLGDHPIDVFDWVDAFSRALTERPTRVVPRPVLASLALCGEIAKWLGLAAPLFRSRYRSMTEDYPTPMWPTFQLLGSPPISLEEGVSETVAWLRAQDKFWCPASGRKH
jgi:nucleoside-diphosphate-sugar epimerase